MTDTASTETAVSADVDDSPLMSEKRRMSAVQHSDPSFLVPSMLHSMTSINLLRSIGLHLIQHLYLDPNHQMKPIHCEEEVTSAVEHRVLQEGSDRIGIRMTIARRSSE